MEKVLITGGTGLIGNHLTRLLISEGFEVFHLSRHIQPESKVKTYRWDLKNNYLEAEALNVDHVIHLAGTSVAKYWTSAYRREIIESRVKSATLLFDHLTVNQARLISFISSSAVGYYGDAGTQWLNEDSPPGKDFLAEVCIQWEEAAKQFLPLCNRVVIIRTGIVLAREGGTLPELLKPLRFGIASVFGNGTQYYSWIHIDDLCRIYLQGIRNASLNGVYNGVAPTPKPFKLLMNAIATVKGSLKINMPVPAFALKIALDGFGATLINSARCSSEKIYQTGFSFRYRELEEALKDLIESAQSA